MRQRTAGTWFEVADFDHAVVRVGELEAAIVRDVELNATNGLEQHDEQWIGAARCAG